MRSRLYEGRVWHTRREPAYTFEYTVWYLGLDLDETADVAKKLRLFSHNRLNLTSFWDRDYLALEGNDGIEAPEGGSVELVTMPRFLNHVFNPVSFFLRRDGTGRVADVTAEVHNTWSERHLYHLAREPGSDTYTSSATKAFYVSPFIDMKGDYRFELREEGNRLRVRIDEYDGDEWFFGSGIDVTSKPLTDGNLAQLLLKYPFVNLKTVAMIHWQGLRVWRRGERFRANPSRRKQGRNAASQTATGEQ